MPFPVLLLSASNTSNLHTKENFLYGRRAFMYIGKNGTHCERRNSGRRKRPGRKFRKIVTLLFRDAVIGNGFTTSSFLRLESCMVSTLYRSRDLRGARRGVYRAWGGVPGIRCGVYRAWHGVPGVWRSCTGHGAAYPGSGAQ